MWCELMVSSVIRINLPWLIQLLRRKFMKTEFLSDLCLKGVHRHLLPAFAVCQGLQLKLVNTPQWHVCGDTQTAY